MYVCMQVYQVVKFLQILQPEFSEYKNSSVFCVMHTVYLPDPSGLISWTIHY
jgi:hypothetical protein